MPCTIRIFGVGVATCPVGSGYYMYVVCYMYVMLLVRVRAALEVMRGVGIMRFWI